MLFRSVVENAVRYGVTRREEGGAVTISTRDKGDCIQVSITDNGVGFDPMKKQYDGRSHIGIDNVRSRLESMCSGGMKIDSTPGRGTTVTLTIPKGSEG